VVWGGVAPGLRPEPVEEVEGVQLGEAHPCSAFPGEADVGDLGGGEHAVLVEEAADEPVPFGQATDHGEEMDLGVTPSATATAAPIGAYRRCILAW
jgi:hypothetical protein